MRVAIIENMKNTHLGLVGIALAEARAEIEWIRVWDGAALPSSVDDHDALIVLGGEQSALDDEAHPYLPELAKLMRAFADVDKAVLGICLGSQVLARAYGAENRLGVSREFGWHSVELTDEGLADPLFADVSETFPIFQFHSDTYLLPEGAVRLASNAATPNQAFRIGRAAYGTQFHFEADRKVVEAWQSESPDVVERMHPGWLQRYPEIAERYAETADAAGLAIARAWVAMVGRVVEPLREVS